MKNFKKVGKLEEIIEPGRYEFKNKRFELEFFAEENCGLLGWNLTGYYGRNGNSVEIYTNGGGMNSQIYQCKKLSTILKHVNNLMSFYL